MIRQVLSAVNIRRFFRYFNGVEINGFQDFLGVVNCNKRDRTELLLGLKRSPLIFLEQLYSGCRLITFRKHLFTPNEIKSANFILKVIKYG